MKKNLERIIALFLIIILGVGGLSGCVFFQAAEYDISDGYDDPDDYIEPEYDFTVACTHDKTTISLSDIGYYGDTAELVYLKPFDYLAGEEVFGLAEERNATPTVIGEYECETEQTYTIDRYNEEGYDTIYCKFFVVQGSRILAGPVYPTEIQPIYTHEEVVKTTGIKGIMCEDRYDPEVENLACEHTELNFVATGMFVPNEYVDEETGEITPIEYEEHLDENGKGYIYGPWKEGIWANPQYVEAIESNGKKYYFRTQNWNVFADIGAYDRLISAYTRDNVKVTIIILVALHREQRIQPYFLTYEEARDSDYSPYAAIDTSNEYGAGYWAAFMEFVARRYSQEDSIVDAQFGTVESYVPGNEVDSASAWYNIVNVNKHEKLNTEDFTIEYERMLRITNQSLKKVYSRNIALISLDHFWTATFSERDYAPKEMLDIIATKTNKEGNYNWGLAIHPYGFALSSPEFWNNDVGSGCTGSLNSTAITWTNLEVLQLYLEQRNKLYSGKVRDVYVTEGGVSSSDGEGEDKTLYNKTKNQQAAGVAYAYYKCTQLPCIKALNYYRLYDNLAERAYFGLLTQNGVRKPSYEVYKYVDTQWTWDVSNPYLEYIEWSRFENGSRVPYGKRIGNVHEYKDTMPLVLSMFDWDARWDESKIVTRYTDEIPTL